MGIELLFKHKQVDDALSVFKLNMLEFPKSYNVYDSYAFALKEKGYFKESIFYYKKGFAILSKYSTQKNPAIEKDIKNAMKYISEMETGYTVQNDRKQSYFKQKPPGERAELFAPEIFNFPEGYHSPVIFSLDGTEAYYTPMTQNSVTHKMIFTSGVWSDPFEVNFGLTKGIADPVFSPDGGRLR